MRINAVCLLFVLLLLLYCVNCQERDLTPLRTATNQLRAAELPALHVHLTSNQLFRCIDQLRDGVDQLPDVIAEVEKAVQSYSLLGAVRTKLVCNW